MGHTLLWIESLVVVLLLEATLLACLSRLRRPWVRRVLAALVWLVPMIVTRA